jgi:hypothetical protein
MEVNMTPGAQGVFYLCVFSGIFCAYTAKKKDKSPWKWGAVGFFIIGPLAYILIYIIMAMLAAFSNK